MPSPFGFALPSSDLAAAHQWAAALWAAEERRKLHEAILASRGELFATPPRTLADQASAQAAFLHDPSVPIYNRIFQPGAGAFDLAMGMAAGAAPRGAALPPLVARLALGSLANQAAGGPPSPGTTDALAAILRPGGSVIRGRAPQGRYRRTRPVSPTAQVTTPSGKVIDVPVQRWQPPSDRPARVGGFLPPGARPTPTPDPIDAASALIPTGSARGTKFSASEAAPAGVTIPDQVAAISDLGNWLNHIRAATPEIVPNATALGHTKDWRGGGRNISTKVDPLRRTSKRVSIGVRGPAATTVADIQRLETFRPKLEAQIEDAIRAAMTEQDPMRRDDLISAARELRDRWSSLYFVRTPGEERPTNEEKYVPAAAGRHGTQGVDPSNYSHMAPGYGVGSENWVQQLARRIGAIDDPSNPIIPGGFAEPSGDLVSEVASRSGAQPMRIFQPKAEMSGMDQRRLLEIAATGSSAISRDAAYQALASTRTWGDAYRALHAKFGRAATEDLLFRAGFDGVAGKERGAKQKPLIPFQPIRRTPPETGGSSNRH